MSKTISKIIFKLMLILVSGAILTSCSQQNKTQDVPNIIFIMSDDHAYQAISAYNDRFKDVAPTPNIDRIASQGMIFNRCVGATIGRMTPGQRSKWMATYIPVLEELERKNPQGDDLLRWKYQRYMNDYLACIQTVDDSVGRVLDYLKENELEKNTIVIYTSDQGFYLGEHGWFDKRFMYEESYRTPLLISWPGVIKPGSVNNDIVSNLDFAVSFLDAAGVLIPDDMQGASLVSIWKGITPTDWRKEHYYHYYEYPGYHSVKRHYGISNERYKLIHFYYDIDEWEMYDLKSDPNEMRNIYNDPAYYETRQQLKKKLDELMIKYGDSAELANSLLPESN